MRSRTSQPEGCFYQEKYPWPITTDRVSQTGGTNGSGIVDLQSKEPRPTPPS